MNIRQSYVLAAMTVLLLSACDNNPKFYVEGIITEADGKTLYLDAMTLNGINTLDSVKLKMTGEFQFKTDAPTNPEFYALRIDGQHIYFSIDSTETVRFKAELPTLSSTYSVEGSDNCQRIKEISLLQAQLQGQILAIENNQSLYPGDIIDSINVILKAYKENMKTNYIYSDPTQTSAYYAVCQSITDINTTYQVFNPLTDRDDVKCYATIATAWDGCYPDAKRTEQICNLAIKGMENTAPKTTKTVKFDESKVSEVGIIDIALPDINSQIRRLTELKGKVVMLDFTLYGAPESAVRTRYMRELYNKYQSKGFEIFQVSLDSDNHFWKFSCEKIPWICVHETNGDAVKFYGVVNLPTFFLINRDNELVIRSDQLSTTLEEEIKQLL